ncbi:hypothetical protein ACIPUC_01185 [Streptomyces sp. LARHCF249]
MTDLDHGNRTIPLDESVDILSGGHLLMRDGVSYAPHSCSEHRTEETGTDAICRDSRTTLVPPGRDAACPGRIAPGSRDQLWEQLMEQDPLGSTWGGDDPDTAPGLVRSPTFSSYGWNATVAQQLATPSLVLHGLDDIVTSSNNSTVIYDNLPVANKVLVHVRCASHTALLEGCSGPRCPPETGTPYGGRRGRPWAGPHATIQAALIEWIKKGTFNGTPNGRFVVDESGVANPAGTATGAGRDIMPQSR